MRKNVFVQVTAIILSAVILFSSCKSTTMLTSSPSGAKLYMNGESVGTTPYTYTDTKVSGTTTILKITADGYEDFNGVLKRNEEADAGAIIGGIFFLFPFIWTMKYKPMHIYELDPIK